MLAEIPPHGCGWPGPRTYGGVAEWWWVVSEMRLLPRAGRRSAGFCGDGRARPGVHAVGVRARGGWAIWSVAGH